MNDDSVLKYAIPTVFAVRGTIDPLVIAICFGMVAGWLGRAAIMYDQEKSWREIVRSMVVSVLAGAGGALAAYFAVIKLNMDPLGAAMLAFGIAASGVRTVKIVAGGSVRIMEWMVKTLAKEAIQAKSKDDKIL